MRFVAHTDGGSRSGKGAIGVVIRGKDSVSTISKPIGNATNNEAEYLALIEALDWMVRQKPDEVEVLMDSELIVKQMSGEYSVHEKLLPLYTKAKALVLMFRKISINHVMREFNEEADALVNAAFK